MEMAQIHEAHQAPSLPRLFGSFLRLGVTAFSGPAMIAYVRRMAVGQRKWLDGESFQDGVALCQVIPGATVMQMAAYLEVATAQNLALSTERANVRLRGQQLVAAVSLIKSLGGGWHESH